MSPPARRPPARVSHPDKVFWPDEGYTKLDLVRFYEHVFPALRPYVADRLLTLERCPDGLPGRCFFQREAPAGLPAGTATKRVRDATGHTTYVVGGTLATQTALTNLGCIAVHVWASRAAAPRRPDWVCFDLDPPSGAFADAARAGLRVKAELDALGLTSFPKTSGGRGLHVFVPIQVGPDNADVLAFAEAVVAIVAERYPKEVTTEARRAARGTRVYLDPFRNGFAQTVCTPYCVRHRPAAPVSTPLDWSEVTPRLRPERFNLGNFAKRLAAGNPWDRFFRTRQPFGRAAQAVAGVRGKGARA